MRIIDNTPFDQPAIGRFIETSDPVWQLEENILYILPNVSEKSRSEADDTLSKLEEFMDREDYINTYSHYVMDEELVLDGNEELDRLLKSGEYDFILPMNRPGNDKSLYLLAKTDKRGIYDTVCLMFHTAERVTKRSLSRILTKKILADTGKELDKISPSISSQEFQQGFLITCCLNIIRPSFGLSPSLPSLNDALGIKAGDSEFTKNQKMISNIKLLVERSKKYNDEEATRALDSLFSNLANRQLLMYALLDDYTPGQIDRFSKSMNLPQKAMSSKVKIEIEKIPLPKDGYERLKDHKRDKVDGEYILFFKKGKKEQHVRFKDRKSFIVYLMYLIDRIKRGDNVTPLNLKEQEQTYKALYKIVYPHASGCDSSFMTLTSNTKLGEDGLYKSRRTKISDCLCEIRAKIGNTCMTLKECPVIHIIPSPNDHIHTLPERIVLPEIFLKH